MDDPIYFPDVVMVDGCQVKLVGLREICQGGPAVGTLTVNGKVVSPDKLYGGPMIVGRNAVYLTERKRSIFFNGFRMMKLDPASGKLHYLGVQADLIYIKSIGRAGLKYSFYLDGGDEHVIEV